MFRAADHALGARIATPSSGVDAAVRARDQRRFGDRVVVAKAQAAGRPSRPVSARIRGRPASDSLGSIQRGAQAKPSQDAREWFEKGLALEEETSTRRWRI
jgi:hypothetical protein